MKNQFASRKPTTAAATPGMMPPIAPTATTSERNSSSTVSRPMSSRAAMRNTVRSGSPTAASTQPATWRRRGSGDAQRIFGRRDGRGSLGARSGPWEMTCTSIGTASRTARLITDPRRSSLQRDRRLAPSTSCVQFSARAKSASAAATSLATTSWYSPPRSARSCRWRDEVLRPRPGHVLRPY